MKKKILFAFAILAVLSLAIAAFAYGGIAVTNVGDKASCCKKDSCPMKSGDHAKMEGHDCCGDSCPMKKKEGASTAIAVSASDDGKSCCDNCDCCKAKEKTDTAAV